MNRTLLLLTLTLSMNLFAQTNKLSKYDFKGALNLNKNNLEKVEVAASVDRNFLSESNSDDFIKFKYYKPSELIGIYDSIFYWEWDAENLEWYQFSKRIEIQYNENHHQISGLNQKWTNGSWENWYSYTYSYDINDNIVSQLFQSWIENNWENSTLNLFTYDSNQNLVSLLTQNSVNNTWVNYSITISTFDENNNKISTLYQIWQNNTWKNTSLNTYTYDENNNLISKIRQTWQYDNTWINSTKNIYTYDSYNNIWTILDQEWNDNNWEDYTLMTYNYNSFNNPVSAIEQIWNNNNWEDDLKYTYSYDENNNLIELLILYWYNNNWVNSWQNTSTFSPDNFMLSDVIKVWTYDGTTIEYGDSTYIHFHTILNEDEWIVNGNNVIVFPNPCSEKFTIESNLIFDSIEIYNIYGELVYAIPSSNAKLSMDINIVERPNGIYFVKLLVGTKTITKKIIKQ